MTTTSFGRRIGNDNFPKVVARVLREAAEQSKTSFGSTPYLDNHAHALGELADLIDTAGLEDQLVRALWLVQGGTGGSTDTYTPGERAARQTRRRSPATSPTPTARRLDAARKPDLDMAPAARETVTGTPAGSVGKTHRAKGVDI